jgi:ATP-dependent DNA ligase
LELRVEPEKLRGHPNLVRGANPKKSVPKKANKVQQGAVAAKNLIQEFPRIALPIRPPFPPAEAKSVSEIPKGPNWLYEPKWDGFRCIAFRSGKQVVLQSKAGQPLDRYFPEMVQALVTLPQSRFILDGELVIYVEKHLSFDDLLMRSHPAASRVKKLAAETPATYMCFDLLVDEGKPLVSRPLAERRRKLGKFFEKVDSKNSVWLSPASEDRGQAKKWMNELAKMGLDGVVAKKLDEPYHSGDATGW